MKKKKKQRLLIPFVGLGDGNHQFEFEIDSSFFEQFDFSIIEDATFKVKVDLEKKPSLFNLHFDFEGTILLHCDKCNDELEFHTNGEEDLIVKFGESKLEDVDEIKVITPSEYELDLTEEIYEYMHLLLPNKIVHEKEKDCNQKVLEKLKELNNKKETKEVDPRWAALSKFKDNND